MTLRARGGGRKPPNRDGQGVRFDDKSSPNTNSPPSSVLPITMKSTHPIYERPSLPILHEQDVEHYVGESTPTTFSSEPTINQPSPIQGSHTHEYESGNVVDQRPWLHAKKGE